MRKKKENIEYEWFQIKSTIMKWWRKFKWMKPINVQTKFNKFTARQRRWWWLKIKELETILLYTYLKGKRKKRNCKKNAGKLQRLSREYTNTMIMNTKLIACILSYKVMLQTKMWNVQAIALTASITKSSAMPHFSFVSEIPFFFQSFVFADFHFVFSVIMPFFPQTFSSN